MNSVSSDMDEPDLSPPRDVVTPRRTSVPLPAMLVAALLVVALVFHLARGPPFKLSIPTGSLSSFQQLWQSRASDDASTLPLGVKAAVEELVASAIRAQRVARRPPPDYALRANGGKVVLPLTSGQGSFLSSREDDPGVALDDDVHVGRCWRAHALPFQLGVRLSRMLHPSHISVEHLPTEISLDIGEAPKNMTLWAVVEGRHNKEVYEELVAAGLSREGQAPIIAWGLLWAPLASFAYDIHDELPVQTFPVSELFVRNPFSVGVVAVGVHDNWGSTTTCLYRVRIHGNPV